MGHGGSDFSAWEKSRLGWLAGITHANRAGHYLIAESDVPASGPR